MPPRKAFGPKLIAVQKQEESNDQNENREFNENNYQKNIKALYKMRTFCSVNNGAAAGIFAFNGLNGILFYIFMFLLISFVIYTYLGNKHHLYFKQKQDIILAGISNDLLLYIMMWVIFHNLVNVL